MNDVAAGGAPRLVTQGDGALLLCGALTFDTVPQLHADGLALLGQGDGTVTIDLSDVNRADSAGLALLVEWLRVAQQRRRGLKYLNVPEQLRSLIRVNGLSRALGVNNDNK